MAMRDNINERRAYIKRLLDGGSGIDQMTMKSIVKMFDSSIPAITNDISVITTGQQAYHKPQTTTQNVRSRRIGATGTLTESEWRAVLKSHGNSCAHCGSKTQLTIDHIKPLSRGGTNTIDNIQPLCKSCNSRKGNR